jgi:hypothetical protein
MMPLGVIEGFYGPLWSTQERRACIAHLAEHGYGFWHYAPKADPQVRTAWRHRWPDDAAESLAHLARLCRDHGLRFGIGITPLGLGETSPAADWGALEHRLVELDAIGIDELVLCFDDVRGDVPDLAQQQIRIAHWAAARSRADTVVVCPTYYTDDPLLDRLFGTRPANYLADLGAGLDAAIGVYWAGEEVCAREITRGHVERIAETLQRPPRLWDNYPVNDSPRMSQHLHLRPFTGRDPGIAEVAAAHAINPALQPTLSTVPALTLAERYRLGTAYESMPAFRHAASDVLGVDLAPQVERDLALLADTGRDRLTDSRAELRARYAAYDHPAAREIATWLDGGYRPEDAAPDG